MGQVGELTDSGSLPAGLAEAAGASIFLEKEGELVEAVMVEQDLADTVIVWSHFCEEWETVWV